MSLSLRGRVVLPDAVLEDGVVVVDGRTITAVHPAGGLDAGARRVPLIAPGLIDIHCHGGGGHSFSVADTAEIRQAADHHLARGTTTMLASLVSAEPSSLAGALASIADVVRRGGTGLIGSHLEGPFLGPGHCGAHDSALLLEPSTDLADSWLVAGDGTLRMITLAPELPGSAAVADRFCDAGVLVALGHTDADTATFAAALARPSTSLVTHLFNGMAALHHRDPGPAGAALAGLARGDCRVELIADGQHVAAALIELVFALERSGQVILVSDGIAAAGMPDGEYSVGPLPVQVIDGTARTRTGSLAGSTVHLADAVRHCIVDVGIDPVAALRAATATPADALGLTDRGRIAPGLAADLVVLDEDWRVTEVFQQGTPIQ